MVADGTGHEVEVPIGMLKLEGVVNVSPGARAIVLFAHGTGSSRLSPRNQFVARVLEEAGLATLLMDLLTSEEEQSNYDLRFDIGLLAQRLGRATDWLAEQAETRDLKVGYFGASTGAAAALIAASLRADAIGAVVSRGGRPDLAARVLDQVEAPTLLIVGGNDHAVIEMNREAFEQLNVEKKMEIVPGAGHLFEELGTLEKVAELARDWFLHHLT